LEDHVHFSRYAAGAFAATALLSTQAYAQGADAIASLRRDMETLRQDYEARVTDLEARLAQAEAAAAAARQATETASQVGGGGSASSDPVFVDAAPLPAPSEMAQSANAFNPAMSVVLNGFITSASEDTGGERIVGVASGGEIENPPLGLSLGESELALSANIDPYFYGFMVAAIDNAGEIGVEEAYIQTTSLPASLTFTAGRFFSGIGYSNETHAHNWAFSDAALPYRAFLGSQLGDDGVQLRWLAPTPFYLEFGAEAFRGDSYPAAGGANDGIGSNAAFIRTGGDIDVSNSFLASASYLQARAIERDSGGDLFRGGTSLLIGSLTYKWAPNGNRLNRNFTATGEVFIGNEDGAFNGIPVDQDRFGWYAQGVYQFMPRWRVGARYAALSSDNPGVLLAETALDDMGLDAFTATALLEFDPSEFSRLRLQYSRDGSGFDPNDILTMQYTVIYGVHGAHRY
jgi:hypothetical protein